MLAGRPTSIVLLQHLTWRLTRPADQPAYLANARLPTPSQVYSELSSRVRRRGNSLFDLHDYSRRPPSVVLEAPSAGDWVRRRHGLLHQRRQVHRDRRVDWLPSANSQ